VSPLWGKKLKIICDSLSKIPALYAVRNVTGNDTVEANKYKHSK